MKLFLYEIFMQNILQIPEKGLQYKLLAFRQLPNGSHSCGGWKSSARFVCIGKGDIVVVSYQFLMDLALILLSTKLLSMATLKIHMPQVVGSLMAGLILGPSILNVLTETQFLSEMSELGVIVLMFTAGLGTDIKELKKAGKSGFLVALCGVLVPLVMGAGLAYFGGQAGLIDIGGYLSDLFVGTILTATSVSITVETLKEMGKLNTAVGNTILAAALIDDVLGLIVLTLVSSFAGDGANIYLVLVKIALFFVFALVLGLLAVRFFDWMTERSSGRDLHRFPLMAFVLCLVMSYCAEVYFGVADIIGAFGAGLAVASTSKAKFIESKFEPISSLLLTPIFFASIGISAQLPAASGKMLLFSVLLLAVAVFSKLVGCGLGAKICHFDSQECVQIGTGMACRGEVALIVANKGLSMGVLNSMFMGPVIITVICCSILTPVMLKVLFRNQTEVSLQESNLVDKYSETEQLDLVSEQLLQANRALMEGGAKAKAPKQPKQRRQPVRACAVKEK